MNRLSNDHLSRRRFLMSAGLAGAAAWVTPRSLFARVLTARGFAEPDGIVQQFRLAAATAVMGTERLRDNAWLITGSGCNVVAFGRRDGVTLVDSGIVGYKVMGALREGTRARITHLVNTHWHFDHTDANAWFHDRGATIVAHANTRRHLSVDMHVEEWFHHTFPASPAGALPMRVIASGETLAVPSPAPVTLETYRPAHTDSDLSVYSPDADVLCTGDTWWNGFYPFIDYVTGGSIDGMIRAADATLARVTPATIIVPGHGAPGRKDDVLKYRDTLATIRANVTALKTHGLTRDEVVAQKPTAAFDAAWGRGYIDPAFFVALVYKGV